MRLVCKAVCELEFAHKTVLLNEAVQALDIKPDGIYIDGTAGGGGHSAEILKRLTTGTLVSIDRDPDAIETVTQRFKGNKCSKIVQSEFSQMDRAIEALGITSVDGILLDLGVSSWQLDSAERGFSYHKDAPLDMRMSQSGVTAAELVNTLSAKELARIFTQYGEEKFAFRIANNIVKKRENSLIETTGELAEIIKESYPASARRDGHPARKAFQALRIAVNGELDELETGLEKSFRLLKSGGILAVITFHSIEDRIVKKAMAKWCKGCICPGDFPVCVCNRTPAAELVFRHPLEPSEEELKDNNRSRSARLRACRKIHEPYDD